MICIVISFFDNINGPRPLLSIPNTLNDIDLNNIASLIDKTFETGFFIYEFPEYKTANYFFEIESEWARGNKEMVLLTIVFDLNFDYNSLDLQTIMNDFINELSNITNLFKAFYIFDFNRKKDNEVKFYYEKLKELIIDFKGSLPKETLAVNQNQIKIFVFGLDRAGKSTILNRAKTNLFVKTSPTINLNIMHLLFGNIQLDCFDVSGQKRYRYTWRRFIVSSQYLVFVLDVNREDRYEEAKIELWKVLSYEESKGIPLLILINKTDLKKKIDLNYFINFLNLYKIKDRKWHIMSTSALYNQGIKEAFEYIIKDLLSNQLTMFSM